MDASQYLIKPVAEDKITYVLDRFLVEKEERDKYILLKIEGRIAKVAVKDIIYCEARGKIQCMYLADDREHLRYAGTGIEIIICNQSSESL